MSSRHKASLFIKVFKGVYLYLYIYKCKRKRKEDKLT